jgi:hypothetical protein
MTRYNVAFTVLAIGLLLIFLQPAPVGANAQAAAHIAPQPPIELGVIARAASSSTLTLQVTLTPRAAVSPVTVEVKLPQGVSSVGEPRVTRRVEQNAITGHSFSLRVDTTASFRPLIVTARGMMADAPVGNAVAVYVRTTAKGLEILSQAEYSARYTSTKSQFRLQALSASSEPDSPDSQEPESAASTIKVKGKFVYPDHAATPQGIEQNSVYRPIRFAQLQIQKKAGTSWQTIKTLHTNQTGNYGKKVSGVTIGTTKIRVYLCLKGPGDDKVQVTSSSGALYCYYSTTKKAAAVLDFGTLTPQDDDDSSGQVNVFDSLIDGYNYVTAIQYTGQALQVKWSLNYNPPLCGTPCSYYKNNVIDLNGTATAGAQWDDSIILHEFGHWVMDRYAAIPPNAQGQHGSCNEGASTPNLEYSEGWATFFQSAARTSSTNPAHSVYGNRYIDVGGGIGSTLIHFAANLEDKTGATYFDQNTNRGGYCEWGVAAALLDVFDSSNSGADALTRSFADILTAARTPSNGHFPYNLNQWWYGWTNTLGNRGGGSLGNESEMSSNLADHRVDVGVRFIMSWGSDPEDLDSHLWLPSANGYHVSYLGLGYPFGYPYADLDFDDTTGNGPETLWMRSPYPGTYYYAVFDFTDQYDDDYGIAGTGAQVQVLDGNSPAYPAAIRTVPGSGSGDWWNLATVDGASGAIAYPNVVQTGSPGPYGAMEAMMPK